MKKMLISLVLIILISKCNGQIFESYFNNGTEKSKIGDYKGAILDLNKAIELNPAFPGAYLNRGITKDKLQDYKGAIADYKKAIELKADYADAYFNRGNLKSLLNDKNSSCQDFSKAGKLGSTEAYDKIKTYCN